MSSDPLNPNRGRPNFANRLLVFTALFFGIMFIMQKYFPPEEPKKVASETAAVASADGSASDSTNEPDTQAENTPIIPETIAKDQFVTIGSADPADPYRMLVTLSSRGAAVRRVEMSDPKYYDIDTRCGYLGEVVVDTKNVGIASESPSQSDVAVNTTTVPADSAVTVDADKAAADATAVADKTATKCVVEVVGAGTPAQKAGLQVGDEILSVAGQNVADRYGLDAALVTTKPGQTIPVKIRRGEGDAASELELSATLKWKPAELIRPEKDAPGSFLLTIQEVDGVTLEQPIPLPEDLKCVPPSLTKEIDGVHLLNEPWEIESATQDKVVFKRAVPKYDLEVRKIFEMVRTDSVAGDGGKISPDAPAYHLNYRIETKNVGTKPHTVAYRYDGPNGLPTEAWWYSMKVSREWGQTLGVRDVVYGVEREADYMVPFTLPARNVAKGDLSEDTELGLASSPVSYMGVDAVYFAVAMLPTYPEKMAIENRAAPFTKWRPVRYGSVEPKHEHLANCSFVLTGKTTEIAAGGSVAEDYRIFAGPKRSGLLAEYGLSSLLYFGWFSWVSIFLLSIMHGVTSVCPYVIGIIVLTVLVRLAIHPLSRVQAINGLKMQMIQPEMAKVREKYKTDPMAMRQAQAALFQKHHFKPQIGCLLIFIQLPIFMGLWRGVMLDVEARGASLFGRSIAWCRDLSAPDRLFAWDSWMPAYFADGSGWLGPFFNLLPVIVVILFLWQQQKMMPPAIDDQGRMQQKMMKFMMIFMGLLFFKVPSGLCIYMIIVTFWGVCERHFLPKSITQDPALLAAQAATIDVKVIDPKRKPRSKQLKKKKR